METWLNGWERDGDVVWMGHAVCAGCGCFLGTAALVVTGDEILPEKQPNFPFTVGDCPVCKNRHKEQIYLSPEELAENYSLGQLRQALAIKKSLLIQKAIT